MGVWDERGKLTRLAILQADGKKPKSEEYKNSLREIAKIGSAPHTEKSLDKAVEKIIADIEEYKNSKENLGKLYQPPLEKIYDFLSKAYAEVETTDASKSR
jgi:prefoldin subunit 5